MLAKRGLARDLLETCLETCFLETGSVYIPLYMYESDQYKNYKAVLISTLTFSVIKSESLKTEPNLQQVP